MNRACLALGSNLGDRFATLDAAVRRLRAEPGLRVIAVSGYYETAPVDCPPGSGDYINAAAVIETSASPQELLALLLRIERHFGRTRSERNSPRTLDLDLLLYSNTVLDAPNLLLPHPRMHERGFVLIPLAEIAPTAIHPILGTTIAALAATLPASPLRVAQRPPLSHAPLAGLSALVTGSTSGIGFAIARAFVEQGATVITHGRSTMRTAIPRANAFHLTADLADPVAVAQLATDAWAAVPDGLDVLVCNAGADTLTGPAAQWDFEQKLDALLAVDLKATMQLTRDIGTRMKKRGNGSIITVGWDQAEVGMEGDSGQLFAAVKGAIACFTRSLARTLAPEVRVNCIAPGWIRTAWGETASAYWQERVRRETPLGIWGLPEDVADAALWLTSDGARFQTGQTIKVNGGAVS